MQCDDPQSSLQCDDPQSSISLALEMLCVLGGYGRGIENPSRALALRIGTRSGPRRAYTTPHTSTHRVCLDRHRLSAPDGYRAYTQTHKFRHEFTGFITSSHILSTACLSRIRKRSPRLYEWRGWQRGWDALGEAHKPADSVADSLLSSRTRGGSCTFACTGGRWPCRRRPDAIRPPPLEANT